MLVTLVMLATCLVCSAELEFIWDRRTAAESLEESPRRMRTILLPIGVIWLGFKIVFAVVPLLFKLVCAALICYLVYRILREMKLVA